MSGYSGGCRNESISIDKLLLIERRPCTEAVHEGQVHSGFTGFSMKIKEVPINLIKK
jgi:hypothetical protein